MCIRDSDHRVVQIAATCLADDLLRVTSRKPSITHTRPQGPCVIIGSLDRSRIIRSLIDTKQLDVADLKEQWECFTIARLDNNTLVIVGSDRRGAAYGALEL